ncbi:MAG: nucleotidyltransferase family protein, partial [Propionibacteriaceae bacterium]|nr:nucleotidyltransferase family protein [Propionibacteriaceae bacterium]
MSEVKGSGAGRLPQLLLDLAAGREPDDGAMLDEQVLATAMDHRVSGLLWTWARQRSIDPGPKATLAQYDLYIQAHLMRVWALLEDCVNRLSAEGIEVATIKGVTAETRWYSRRGERPCSDVDLVLSPHQLDRAAEVVRLLEPDHPWLDHVGPLATAGRIQAVTTHVAGLEVDLHLDLLKLGFPTRQSADLWARTTSYSLPGGSSVRVLDDTTALVHLLVHLNKDRFQRLLGYADVARVMAAEHVDWARFERFLSTEGLLVSALKTLEVVLDELGLPWPAGLSRPRGLRAWWWDRIWPREIRLRGHEGRLRFRKRQSWMTFLA